MLRSAKLATPLVFVVPLVVPDSVPPVGLVPIEIVTDAPGTRFKKASLTVIRTAGVMCSPVVVIVGWTEKTAVAGAVAVMSKAVLSAVTGDGMLGTVACSLYPVPVLSMLRSAKLATPVAFVGRVVVPESVPPPALTPIESVTDAPGTRFVNASVTVTSTAGAMWTPAVAELGCTEKAALAGAAALTVAGCELVSVPFTVSVTVTVCEPAVNNVTPLLKVCVPSSVGGKVKFAGKLAGKGSVEVKWTVPVYAFGPLATFANASKAVTVTVLATPAVTVAGRPVNTMLAVGPATTLTEPDSGLNVFAEPLTARETGRLPIGCPRRLRTVTVTVAVSTSFATTKPDPPVATAVTLEAAGSGSSTVTFRIAASDRRPVPSSVATTRNAYFPSMSAWKLVAPAAKETALPCGNESSSKPMVEVRASPQAPSGSTAVAESVTVWRRAGNVGELPVVTTTGGRDPQASTWTDAVPTCPS